jgi:hypothetical protein
MISQLNCRRGEGISFQSAKCNSMNPIPISKSRIPTATPSIPDCLDSQTERKAIRAMIRRCKANRFEAVPAAVTTISRIVRICVDFFQKQIDQSLDHFTKVRQFEAK